MQRLPKWVIRIVVLLCIDDLLTYKCVCIYTYIHSYIYIHIHTLSICTHVHTCSPPDPMNHVKILKGWPRRFTLWALVPNWYKTFPPDYFGQAEMNDSTMLRNKTSTA